MLAYISGVFLRRYGNRVIFCSVPAGVGYELIVSPTFQTNLSEVWVWQTLVGDKPIMYGFETDDQRELALELVQLDGIGPTMAARIAFSDVNGSVRELIKQKDGAALARLVKGLGPTKAKTIIDHLAEQLNTQPEQPGSPIELVVEALAGLGHTNVRKQVEEAALCWPDAKVGELVKHVLIQIAKG